MAAVSPPYAIQASSHPADVFRRAWRMLRTQGVRAAADMAVTQNGTPNMSVNVAAGEAIIAGTENALYQGSYHAFNDAVVNLAIAAADPTNPRNDLVVARVRDAAYSGANNDFILAVVTGTPAGSPVDPATPVNAIVLARVRVDAAVGSIVNAKITDLRTMAGLTMPGVIKFAAGFVGANLDFSAISLARIQGGVTDTAFLNNAGTFNNLLITDAGAVTIRSWLALGGTNPVGGISVGDLVVNRGGASPGTGAIFFGSSAGSHYILYDGTKFLFNDPINVTGAVTSGAGGAADATTYQAFIDSSAAVFARTAHQTTIAIAAVATAIINLDNLGYRAMLVFIHGTDGTNYFADLVIWTTGTVTTISSVTDAGAPAARTYSTNANGQLKLAMAAGTYRTNAFGFVLSPR